MERKLSAVMPHNKACTHAPFIWHSNVQLCNMYKCFHICQNLIVFRLPICRKLVGKFLLLQLLLFYLCHCIVVVVVWCLFLFFCSLYHFQIRWLQFASARCAFHIHATCAPYVAALCTASNKWHSHLPQANRIVVATSKRLRKKRSK